MTSTSILDKNRIQGVYDFGTEPLMRAQQEAVVSVTDAYDVAAATSSTATVSLTPATASEVLSALEIGKVYEDKTGHRSRSLPAHSISQDFSCKTELQLRLERGKNSEGESVWRLAGSNTYLKLPDDISLANQLEMAGAEAVLSLNEAVAGWLIDSSVDKVGYDYESLRALSWHITACEFPNDVSVQGSEFYVPMLEALRSGTPVRFVPADSPHLETPKDGITIRTKIGSGLSADETGFEVSPKRGSKDAVVTNAGTMKRWCLWETIHRTYGGTETEFGIDNLPPLFSAMQKIYGDSEYVFVPFHNQFLEMYQPDRLLKKHGLDPNTGFTLINADMHADLAMPRGPGAGEVSIAEWIIRAMQHPLFKNHVWMIPLQFGGAYDYESGRYLNERISDIPKVNGLPGIESAFAGHLLVATKEKHGTKYYRHQETGTVFSVKITKPVEEIDPSQQYSSMLHMHPLYKNVGEVSIQIGFDSASFQKDPFTKMWPIDFEKAMALIAESEEIPNAVSVDLQSTFDLGDVLYRPKGLPYTSRNKYDEWPLEGTDIAQHTFAEHYRGGEAPEIEPSAIVTTDLDYFQTAVGSWSKVKRSFIGQSDVEHYLNSLLSTNTRPLQHVVCDSLAYSESEIETRFINSLFWVFGDSKDLVSDPLATYHRFHRGDGTEIYLSRAQRNDNLRHRVAWLNRMANMISPKLPHPLHKSQGRRRWVERLSLWEGEDLHEIDKVIDQIDRLDVTGSLKKVQPYRSDDPRFAREVHYFNLPAAESIRYKISRARERHLLPTALVSDAFELTSRIARLTEYVSGSQRPHKMRLNLEDTQLSFSFRNVSEFFVKEGRYSVDDTRYNIRFAVPKKEGNDNDRIMFYASFVSGAGILKGYSQSPTGDSFEGPLMSDDKANSLIYQRFSELVTACKYMSDEELMSLVESTPEGYLY